MTKAAHLPPTPISENFSAFAPRASQGDPLREQITASYRCPEAECVKALAKAARLPEELRQPTADLTRKLASTMRERGERSGMEGLMREYSLSSEEGIALMCLAEALLRIPDKRTRDALIADKITGGDWRSHIGGGRSLFVNAASWGLVVTGRLRASADDAGLNASLSRIIHRYGEPVIRSAVNLAMNLMGEQFVLGQTIEEALRRSATQEKRGFTYSYDMLGEAAMTEADAERYYQAYETAIHAIGRANAEKGVIAGPGISIKLSALHPRYSRAQYERVIKELLPRVRELALLAKLYDIGLNIDAEEADRLDISLDVLEALALDPALADWQGLGFVVQAYGKRCSAVIDWLVALAERSGHRLMIRLVKGAYWDSEIKRAQSEGLEDFPVFTRKAHTDISYIAAARKLLAARDKVYPQFATHNAQTLASIYTLAGEDFTPGDYEFQCLHGMGEPLYNQVVGKDQLDRPCRIYAPVGGHETLLAYLVRRLLENGANSSFIHQIWDRSFSLDRLAAEPADTVLSEASPGAPHDLIALPRDLYGERANSLGLDLSDERVLADISEDLQASVPRKWRAAPILAGEADSQEPPPYEDELAAEQVINPAHSGDVVGFVRFASEAEAANAMRAAAAYAEQWGNTATTERAACLEIAADLLEERGPKLLGLIMREAGKTLPNAVAEWREAVDFLRYYAAEARRTLAPQAHPLGPVACISPWNFPLAIFIGQVSAALVAGNTVLAKPAEETPLIAAEAVHILHEAGVPREALQLLPGEGNIGAALVRAGECSGVIFTGSTEVAKLIQRELAGRLSPQATPVPLIAETGGQNAMIVDSTALPEQVVADVLASAFDSAGQRCSALRVLCVQDDVADTMIAMLKGAMAELHVSTPTVLRCDVGPVITAEAQRNIEAHIKAMEQRGFDVWQTPLGKASANGTFVPPTLIEIDDITALKREVFGPVLHVLRYKRRHLDRLITQINATGYGLTFGLHSRIDSTMAQLTDEIKVGNIYINRNVIGAIVGVQPFGGRGLSGTGPKAGGPLYLHRLSVVPPPSDMLTGEAPTERLPNLPAFDALIRWFAEHEMHEHSEIAAYAQASSLRPGLSLHLPGPVGEDNIYELHRRGRVLAFAPTAEALYHQLTAILATGNRPMLTDTVENRDFVAALPAAIAETIRWTGPWRGGDPMPVSPPAIIISHDHPQKAEIVESAARSDGPLPLVQVSSARHEYRLDWLVEEVAISVNTAAAGGNARLMALA